ncbi:alpha/beta fold hydrolase [Pseudomonas gingeri]|uniref:Alpha/beta hydrolase n=1 Tax=Pseudomonas gingeri TaxID=117681 RepID=A0A7Y8CKI3_9PSED|nr:alpha/beta hydrolase [Pseudomonas gingeri]NVZ99503.1 alpha/beta hydrolase [Pseudomonas gingeri]NWA15475.1 alpha/beta hydrolase [Pseudomonas gingeri]NWA56702.1 alpha/beta hydrolase [Pseudomonas gingeri]NWA95196.1 alpha/beta hydrolase [Pseudomonas gingeri]NWB05278.1 alpha/beta hydrolase [Pseudomonas gingeri]
MSRTRYQWLGMLWLITGPGISSVRAEPLQDAHDPGVSSFYEWTAKVPGKPGQLLRTEPLTPQQSLAEAGRNIRLLYTSTDGVGNPLPNVVSGALFIPGGTPPKGGWPLMAWAHGTVGSADVCAPSLTRRSERDSRYLNHWLAQGYAIVATDYQGLGTPGPHPYGLTRPLAYNTLDSIRAVVHDNFALSTRVVVFGQSQGGRAAFATAVYAKTYAPELDIVGVVATGTPYAAVHQRAANRERSNAHGSVVPTFAYNLLRLDTARLLDPSFVPTDYLNEQAIPTYELSRRGCLHEIEQQVVANKLTFDNSFKRSPKAAFAAITQAAAYPTLKSDIPIFIGTGGKDRDVFVPDQKALVRDTCKAGNRIEWHLYPQLDHSATVNGSLPDSTRFVARAFAGEWIAGNCATKAPLSDSDR